MRTFSDIRGQVSGQHVMLATTVYADPSCAYTFSLATCRETLRDAGITTSLFIVTGNCYLDDARNMVVEAFLKSPCTDLVFLDADVAWRPDQLLTLCQFQDVDIVGGIYPKRSRLDPSMPVNMLPNGEGERRPGLLEVASLPTGFLRIRRHVLETMTTKCKTYGPTKRPWLFRLDADENGDRVGEDFRFCNDWRKHFGGRLWAATDLRLLHVGQDIIQRSLAEALRAQEGSTLQYVANEVAEGRVTLDLIGEALEASGNLTHVGGADFLIACIEHARKAKLPVLELGTGISTVLMAAAGAEVHALEESPDWAKRTDAMLEQAGVDAQIFCTPLTHGWYKVPAELANDYAFLVVDGPEDCHSRFAFIARLPAIPRTVIFDDMDRPEMAERARQWADATGREVVVHSGRLMVVK